MRKGKGKGKKVVPQNATKRGSSKEVRLISRQPDRKPSWRFSTVDRQGPFSWPKEADKQMKIIDKLHSFDGMEWSEIEGSSHHSIAIESLSKEAKERLATIKLDDIDELFSFRLGGKGRIFCIRDNNVAKLLWDDPNHKVCLSTKKHT